MELDLTFTRDLLPRRRGLVFVEAKEEKLPESYMSSVEIKLAGLGYVPNMGCDYCRSEEPLM
jgi:hypothetical protein